MAPRSTRDLRIYQEVVCTAFSAQIQKLYVHTAILNNPHTCFIARLFLFPEPLPHNNNSFSPALVRKYRKLTANASNKYVLRVCTLS